MLYPAGVRAAVIPAIAALCGALASVASAESLQPSGWDRGVALAVAPDLNPDPHVVEVNIDGEELLILRYDEIYFKQKLVALVSTQ